MLPVSVLSEMAAVTIFAANLLMTLRQAPAHVPAIKAASS
jgi:hypothetical protein